MLLYCEIFQVPGVYHFSFTGLFHALNGHGINAHIIWERGREVRHLGSSKADTNENGWPGKYGRKAVEGLGTI